VSSSAITRRRLLGALALGCVAASLDADAQEAAETGPSSTRELWTWARAQQVLSPGVAYLDAASDGPKLRAALVAEYRGREASSQDRAAFETEVFGPVFVRRLVDRVATLTDCAADELALTSSATEALNIAANGLDLRSGDEILTTSHEHDAGIYPWLLQAKRRGVVVKQVPLRSPLSSPEEILGRITAAAGPRTRVLAFSHIQYSDGTVLPARELCAFARERDIVSVVDGAQAPGMHDVSIKDIGCDVYAFSLHKWLSSVGGGALYVRPDLMERLWPLQADDYRGWQDSDRFGQTAPSILTLRAGWPTALRKFGASFALFGPQWQALNAALDINELIGKARGIARVRELAIYARIRLQKLPGIEFLTPVHPLMFAGILSFRSNATPSSHLVEALASEDRVIARHVFHPGSGVDAVRVSTHFYNSYDDIERLARTVQRHAHG
jgi:isopenicillin-N epimerase